MNPLLEPIDVLLGPSAGRLQKAWPDVVTVGDLLLKFPKDYHARGELSGRDLLTVGEFATVVGRVAGIDVRPMRKPRKGDVSTVKIDIEGRQLTATFFNQGRWIKGKLPIGTLWMFSGMVEMFRDQLQLQHPEVEAVQGGQGLPLDGKPLTEEEQRELARLAPSVQASPFIRIYPPATIRTRNSTKVALGNNALSLAITTLLSPLDEVPDPIPRPILDRHGMPDLLAALRLIHHPQKAGDWELGRRRFPFAEAVTLQTLLAQRRRRVREIGAVPRRRVDGGGLLADFDALLPFRLTRGQETVSEQVFADLARPEPMGRLLQGDVGSGKTVVALRAMLAVVDAGGQAVLLAPTEVLAGQHARLVRSLLGPLGRAGELDAPEHATRVALLTGSLPQASRRQALLDIASGAAGIVIGTHALLQENVDFAELALVVVDEQHRFGVEQRAALQAKADSATSDRQVLAHLLVMTATPIPRTIAMTVFGDLDISTLRELPAGRQPIATTVVPAAKPHWVERAWERVAEEIRSGRQAYVVCPRIGGAAADDDVATRDGGSAPDLPEDVDPDPAEGWTITDVLPALQSKPVLEGVRIAALHGRMPAEEKDATMRAFAGGEIDLLLATTVIEVGVDVANATVMLIMGADRFGLSQLHQLRGRVGRGDHAGLCLLLTGLDEEEEAVDRLHQLAATDDGFDVAEIDLRAREEGNVLGQSQHGKSRNLRYLSVINDMDILEATRMDAFGLVEDDPRLTAYPLLAEACLLLDAESEGSFLDKA